MKGSESRKNLINDMKKTIIQVPKGIRFISAWKEFDNLLPHDQPYILDKKIPGCGYTEWCITSGFDVILCSPRVILLENKHEQHMDDVFYYRSGQEIEVDKDLTKPAKDDNTNGEGIPYMNLRDSLLLYCKERSQLGKPRKILVTYDSYYLIRNILEGIGEFWKFRTVVDEMQSIFVDSRFKSDSEIKFLGSIKGIGDLCFVSATPMIEKYLDMIEDFNRLPYYELDWETLDPGRLSTPIIVTKNSRSVAASSQEIIKKYKEGRFDIRYMMDENGNIRTIQSTEAVIYINSVNNIISIVKKNELRPEEVNILCARTEENRKKIRRKLGAGYIIGSVPLRGEPRKMFTFCTRTVYLGADFYSNNAETYIISDANLDTLAVDITLDLPQILGRQRLKENPWSNEATLYYKTLSMGKGISKEMYDEKIAQKEEATKSLIKYCLMPSPKFDKEILMGKLMSAVKYENYKNDYFTIKIDSSGDKIPILNKLVLISEQRAYDIQQIDFKDRFSVFSAIDNQLGTNNEEFRDVMKEYEEQPTLLKKLKFLVTLHNDGLFNDGIKNQLAERHFKEYIDILGWDRIISTGENITRLERELKDRVRTRPIKEDIISTFKVGEIYTRNDIKETLKIIYKQDNYNGTPKATDLKKWFIVEEKLKKINGKATGVMKIMGLK